MKLLLCKYYLLSSFVFLFQIPCYCSENIPVIVCDTIPKTNKLKEDNVFTNVEIQAGPDSKKWIDHLKKTSPVAIEEAIQKKIPVGRYEVELLLTVEKTGEISKIEIEKDPGYGLAEASIKIVRTGPKWKPGESCGRHLRSYKKQPFIYVIEE